MPMDNAEPPIRFVRSGWVVLRYRRSKNGNVSRYAEPAGADAAPRRHPAPPPGRPGNKQLHGNVRSVCVQCSFIVPQPAAFVTTQKGAGASPRPTGTKKPRRAALQPHSGEKDEELLFTCSWGSESGMPLPCSCGCRQSGRPRRSWSSCRYPSRLPSCQGASCRQHSESHPES